LQVKQSSKEPGEGAELLLVASLLYHYLNEERGSGEDVEVSLQIIYFGFIRQHGIDMPEYHQATTL
jgi:hypothetical protein